MERRERQARLTLALGGIAAVAVDLFHSETGRIEQLVRVSPPAREESGEDGTELDVDYLVSPPELTPFLAEALQRSSVYQEPIEIATQGQLSEAACKVAQQLLGVTHLVACRVHADLGVSGLLVMATQREITAAEK